MNNDVLLETWDNRENCEDKKKKKALDEQIRQDRGEEEGKKKKE